jgi:hypothetical protein
MKKRTGVKMRYSIYDESTGYFTKYRTVFVEMELVTNELGFINFDSTFSMCLKKAELIIGELFKPIKYEIIESEVNK